MKPRVQDAVATPASFTVRSVIVVPVPGGTAP